MRVGRIALGLAAAAADARSAGAALYLDRCAAGSAGPAHWPLADGQWHAFPWTTAVMFVMCIGTGSTVRARLRSTAARTGAMCAVMYWTCPLAGQFAAAAPPAWQGAAYAVAMLLMGDAAIHGLGRCMAIALQAIILASSSITEASRGKHAGLSPSSQPPARRGRRSAQPHGHGRDAYAARNARPSP